MLYLQVFSCTYCGVNYKYRHTLNNHLLKKHNVNNNKSYLKKVKCKICDKKFTLKKTMMRHMRTLHLTNITSTPDPDLLVNLNIHKNLIFCNDIIYKSYLHNL